MWGWGSGAWDFFFGIWGLGFGVRSWGGKQVYKVDKHDRLGV